MTEFSLRSKPNLCLVHVCCELPGTRCLYRCVTLGSMEREAPSQKLTASAAPLGELWQPSPQGGEGQVKDSVLLMKQGTGLAGFARKVNRPPQTTNAEKARFREGHHVLRKK